MITLRRELEELGFDWDSGKILYQKTIDFAPGWDEPRDAEYIAATHPILDEEYSRDYGAPTCPRFVAEDKEAFYFPSQYDGATLVEKIWKDLDKYLDFKKNMSPYPGGG
jgi:hypothetical protein